MNKPDFLTHLIKKTLQDHFKHHYDWLKHLKQRPNGRYLRRWATCHSNQFECLAKEIRRFYSLKRRHKNEA